MSEKLKSLWFDDRYFYLIIVVLVALCAFGLGRLSVQTTSNTTGATAPLPDTVRLTTTPTRDDTLTIPVTAVTNASVVASDGGARYYRLDCGGVDRIEQDNRIYFPDVERAQAAGYTPAQRCFD